MSTHTITVQCSNPDEAAAAITVIEAHRSGTALAEQGAPALGSGTSQSGDNPDDLTDRIEAALRKSAPNRAQTILLETLLQTPAGTWLPFGETEAVFKRVGLGVEKARAALGYFSWRYFSWQMKEYMPSGDFAGLTKSIEVMAERTRTDGDHMYRLTPAGRIAVERFLGSTASPSAT
ncbi:MAG: hypothetical protein AAGC86_07240 [Pseudomonadota bacterium]